LEIMFLNVLKAAFHPRAVVLALTLLPCISSHAFGFYDVAHKARLLAEKSYKPPQENISDALKHLSYEQYNEIQFKREDAYWHKERLPFELTFFHEGRAYSSPVQINEVVNGRVHPIPFNPADFDYGSNHISPHDLRHLGFAGFRVHYAINTPKVKDEVMVFLGASYFRGVGKGQVYGLSARGLAIDTALNSGEEFPRFEEFWIERPARGARQLVIYALLNSPRATGAYRFVIRPGAQTVNDIQAQLYLRENVTKLGIAPLTSMYFFGENQRSEHEDYRPEAHDSDGLSIESGTGEWIWRPLVNPKRLLVTSFALSNPVGFGLMQRDQKECDYQDLALRYEDRPSGWVEPIGKWGKGRVELVQIPTPDELNDNIVAYWVPDQLPKPGKPIDFSYRLYWTRGDESQRPPLSWVMQTRRGNGYMPKPDDSIALFVDFEGPIFKKLPADTKVDLRLSADTNAEILESHTYPNPYIGGWRAAIRLKQLDKKKPVELRGFLETNNTTLSETWSYILPPTE